MGKKKRPKTGQCVYCGKIRPITEDHVPPKNIFAKPRPNNLVKVPSCHECHSENKQISKDDEYFRLALTLREDTAKHPDVEQILPVVLRSLSRPDKIGFARSLSKRVKHVNVVTKGGLYLGRKLAFGVSLDRLDNVAIRITKGIFYHEKKCRLPDEYDAVAFSESGLEDLAEDTRQELQKNVLNPLMLNEPKIIGQQVFSYRVAYSENDPNISAWLLVFYERVTFLCLTLPKARIMANQGMQDDAAEPRG
jgi:hypothetical protein